MTKIGGFSFEITCDRARDKRYWLHILTRAAEDATTILDVCKIAYGQAIITPRPAYETRIQCVRKEGYTICNSLTRLDRVTQLSSVKYKSSVPCVTTTFTIHDSVLSGRSKVFLHRSSKLEKTACLIQGRFVRHAYITN